MSRPLPNRARCAALPLLVLMLGCAHGTEPDVSTLASSSDQIIWQAAQQALEKKAWETARQYLKRIVDSFPQSEYGPAARLALGDTYFEEGGMASYILAIEDYRQFLTYYPSHARSDYAQFRVAEAYFKQKNGSDRDPTSTQHALEEFMQLLERYPKTSHGEDARRRIVECRTSLADSEFAVGFFYQRTRKAYRAAIDRFQDLLSEYPDYPALDKVLFRLAQCLSFLARGPEALPHLAKLLEEYPESPHAEEARALYRELAALQPGPIPAPSPSSSPTAPPNP